MPIDIPSLFATPLADVALSSVLWDAFSKSDLFGKFIVAVLFALSLWAGTVIFQKHFELAAYERADKRFFYDFKSQRNPLELFVTGRLPDASPLAQVYRAAAATARREFLSRADKQHRELDQIDLSVERLSPLQIDSIRKNAECAAADQINLIEDQMSVLATIYTLSPMLGLFGTVWGVMVAFYSMGIAGSADLAAVAPGVSSALLTTVVGMVVAIFAAIFSNHLNNRIRFLSVQLENFPDKIATALQQTFVYEE
jgi:biopolymer transport protein ExbB/TolQ